MNGEDSIFSNEDPLIEAPSIDPSFLGCLDVNSVITKSHGI